MTETTATTTAASRWRDGDGDVSDTCHTVTCPSYFKRERPVASYMKSYGVAASYEEGLPARLPACEAGPGPMVGRGKKLRETLKHFLWCPRSWDGPRSRPQPDPWVKWLRRPGHTNLWCNSQCNFWHLLLQYQAAPHLNPSRQLVL